MFTDQSIDEKWCCLRPMYNGAYDVFVLLCDWALSRVLTLNFSCDSGSILIDKLMGYVGTQCRMFECTILCI